MTTNYCFGAVSPEQVARMLDTLTGVCEGILCFDPRQDENGHTYVRVSGRSEWDDAATLRLATNEARTILSSIRGEAAETQP